MIPNTGKKEKRIPHGMTRLIRNSWDSINDAVSKELKHPGILTGINSDHDMYGCGYWGCAYPTNDPQWTVKITADPTEGPIVAAIIQRPYLRNHTGVAYLKKSWKLPEKARWGREEWNSIYVILRENITPFGEEETEEETIALNILDELKKVSYQLNKAINLSDQEGMEYYESKWYDLIEQAEDCWMTYEIADFMIKFKNSFGYVLADIHSGNIGYRKGDIDTPWVTFDVGHSEVASGFDIPVITRQDTIRNS